MPSLTTTRGFISCHWIDFFATEVIPFILVATDCSSPKRAVAFALSKIIAVSIPCQFRESACCDDDHGEGRIRESSRVFNLYVGGITSVKNDRCSLCSASLFDRARIKSKFVNKRLVAPKTRIFRIRAVNTAFQRSVDAAEEARFPPRNLWKPRFVTSPCQSFATVE